MFPASSRETLSLVMMGSGTALLVVTNALAATVWRRADVSYCALMWSGSQAAIHPERFIRPGRVGAVRMLSASGVTLFLLGVVAALVL